MRKYILLGVFVMGASTAFADDLETKITSFNYTGSRTRAAELCGTVNGTGSANAIVTVTVDEKAKTPAKYTTLADEAGAFCLVVASYKGTASATAKPK